MQAAFDSVTQWGQDACDVAVGLDRLGYDVVPWPTAVVPGLDVPFLSLLAADPWKPPDVVLVFGPALGSPVEQPCPTVAWTDDVCGDLGWATSLIVTNPSVRQGVDGAASVAVRGVVERKWPETAREDGPLRFIAAPADDGEEGRLRRIWERLELLDGWDAHMVVMRGWLSREERLERYKAADVFVSLSESGDDKEPVEFMATGGAVIAAPVGDHLNWLLPEVGWVVSTDDDVEDAMRMAWHAPAQARRRGRYAARYARNALSWDTVLPRVARVLERTR